MIRKLLDSKQNNKQVWFLRQAGRYLPEYRSIRKKKKNFLDFCFDKNSVVEATLQPIKRFDLDAAIIFSDILVVPYVLNRKISFIEGFGPRLEPLKLGDEKKLNINREKQNVLFNTYDSIRETRKKLNKNKSLIGFCGGPWTVACYIIDGNSKGGFADSKHWLKKHNSNLQILINILIDQSVEHLYQQYLHGCDTLMIFESWAKLVPKEFMNDFIFFPSQQIIKLLRNRGVDATFIAFPRGLSESVLEYDDFVKPDIISLDQDIDMMWAVKNFNKNKVLQGNICPDKLLDGKLSLYKEIEKLKECVLERSHIFNTGHGILPKTNPETLKKVIEYLRG